MNGTRVAAMHRLSGITMLCTLSDAGPVLYARMLGFTNTPEDERLDLRKNNDHPTARTSGSVRA